MKATAYFLTLVTIVACLSGKAPAQKQAPVVEIYVLDKATGWIVCTYVPEKPAAGPPKYRVISGFGPGEPDAEKPGIYVDKTGRIYASDMYHHRIVRFDN